MWRSVKEDEAVGSNNPITPSTSFVLADYGIKLSSFWITEGQIQQQCQC
jgi:hypothetical protein